MKRWPYILSGHCCGCHSLSDKLLYRMGEDTECHYRCKECFFKATGRLP